MKLLPLLARILLIVVVAGGLYSYRPAPSQKKPVKPNAFHDAETRLT